MDRTRNWASWGLLRTAMTVVAAGALVVTSAGTATGAGDVAVVRTDAGPVRGTVTSDVRSFQGIPFAAPFFITLAVGTTSVTATYTGATTASETLAGTTPVTSGGTPIVPSPVLRTSSTDAP